MRLSFFKLLLIIIVLFPCSLSAQEESGQESYEEPKKPYEKRKDLYLAFWESLIPRYSKIQFAGSMGMFSFGGGWNYYRNHWETDVLFGFVPRNADKHAMVTMTLKQNYIPWRVPIGEHFDFEPLSCGLYINTLFDNDFWVKNPDRYPKGYYWFSTRIRHHIFIGERITLKLDPKKFHNKSITFFYEISSCDLYLVNAFTNSYLKPKDYLSLSFGIKMQIL